MTITQEGQNPTFISASMTAEQAYLKYHDKVLSYIRARVSSSATAEDLCSDVFEKVTRMLSSYDQQKSSVSTWIYAITRNRVIDYFRTAHPHSELPEDLPMDSEIDDSILKEETLGALADALTALPEELQGIIVLHYSKGYPLTQVAEMMHLSYGAVKLRHQKAIELLRKKMQVFL
ncbi:MAG: RNA polymerase sigma factor [Clostridia bacterium]|nr:RNA polymerase sigma factor [Clostridia bacterium]